MNTRDCPHGRLARSCETCADQAEIAELKECIGRGVLAEAAARDQIKKMKGEACILRRLLAEARDVLGTIDPEDAPDEMNNFLAAIDAAIDPTSRDCQQMVIIEVAKTKALHG